MRALSYARFQVAKNAVGPLWVFNNYWGLVAAVEFFNNAKLKKCILHLWNTLHHVQTAFTLILMNQDAHGRRFLNIDPNEW